MFTGIGQHFGPVHCHGDLPKPQHFELLGQLQHLHEALGQERLILTAEAANRVVVRVRVGSEQPHGHTVMGALLDAP